MNKISDQKIRSRFKKKMEDILKFFQQVSNGLKDSERSQLASLTLVSVASIWESYINDLLIAYINRDPKKFIEHKEKIYENSIPSKIKNMHPILIKFESPKSLNRKEIIKLIQEDQKNINPRLRSIKEKAELWIAEEYKAGIASTSSEDEEIVNLVFCLRNHFLHGSEQSKEKLEEALNSREIKNTNFYRETMINRDKVGYYLKSIFDSRKQLSRIEKIIESLKDTGVKL